MNQNFNVVFGHPQHPELLLNNYVRRVEARAPWGMYLLNAKSMRSAVEREGFRIFFGGDVLGTGDQNTARILCRNLVEYEDLVASGSLPAHMPKPLEERAWMRVNLFGESAKFVIQNFAIVCMGASQGSTFMDFEVKVTISQMTP